MQALSSYGQSKHADVARALASLRSPADGLGSVTSLTDPTGTVTASYVYDSFGKLTASTSSLTNPFQYTGREFDSETGLYYYRARYYDPQAGSFLSEDRVRFRGGINFYRYVSNSPINGTDPSGLWSPPAHAQIIWNALHGCKGVSDMDIYNIQQGSRWFDSWTQGAAWAAGHAMSNGLTHQTAQQARNQMTGFVFGELKATSSNLNAGAEDQAMFTFGIAIHPSVDMTGYAHSDNDGNPIP
jgi:RHS repeat-associated protein